MSNTLDLVKAQAPGGAPERPYHQVLADTGNALMDQYWLRERKECHHSLCPR